MIENRFNHKETEKNCNYFWEQREIFHYENRGKDYFCIMMPPPNITGSLHIGHALTFTLQDILIRFHYKNGKNVLWQSGIDHAGIATEIVVERNIKKSKNLTKKDIGRNKFLNEIWKWKDISGGKIINQLKALGTSANWKKSRFTMDEESNKVVRKVFVNLYNEGLIYRDKRLVNWDPEIQSAVSDLEVIQKNIKGNLWYIKYKILNTEKFVTVATTRPETLFGDSAIAIHPTNKKLKHLIGEFALVPFCNRKIPIIGDEYADPKKGSGAVKVTPAHDFNDFIVGKRHNLAMISILDKNGKLDFKEAGEFYGLDRLEVRKKILSKLKKLNLIEKIEKQNMVIPIGDRSGSTIEPMLTNQWFCNAKALAKPIKKFIDNKNLIFFPNKWLNTFNHWINNIEPWCISRQIWWGHRIPAWFTEDGKVIVEEDYEKACEVAKKKFKVENPTLVQDRDVLDTWFSSALWPFSTLGWPKKTKNFKNFYPTSVLITGFDIIFFWVARMVMMGIKFTGNIPFKHVYIHPLVRDAHGQKMSKSKGNVVDPLELIEKYGADAMRFSLSSMSSQGGDIKISSKAVEDSKKFITKLWNVARFAKLNNLNNKTKLEEKKLKLLINKWIVSRYVFFEKKIIKNLNTYNFNLASRNIYQFVWGDFCDLYIEFIKPYLNDKAYYEEISSTFSRVFENTLLLVNPFIPFVSEEISKQLNFTDDYYLSERKFTDKKLDLKFKDLENINKLKVLIHDFRTFKSNPNLETKVLYILDKSIPKWVLFNEMLIKSILNLEEINLSSEHPTLNYKVFISSKSKFGLNQIVKDKNDDEMKKKINFYKKEIIFFENKLKNKKFLLNAPKKIVEEQKNKLEYAKKSLNLLINDF